MKLIKAIFIFFPVFVFSQNYIPVDTTDRKEREQAVMIYQKSVEKFIESVKSKYPGKEGKLMAKRYEEFNKDFEEGIKDGQFCYDSRFTAYINEILGKLRKGNPQISGDLTVLLSKDPSLNAFCLPDGTFVLNMGLFYWLGSDDQVASILAHELSHMILKHSEKRQLSLIQEELSTKSKEQVKSIKKQKYNSSQAALELYKSKLYAAGNMSKINEYEADSLGFVFMRNSSFNEDAFIGALELMVTYDTIKPKGVKEEIYRKLFDLPTQPFKKKWLGKEDFSQYDYSFYKEKIDKDSVSTHPETVQRIEKLKLDFPELKEGFEKSFPTEKFKELQRIAEYERVPALYFFEQYGVAIYICLAQLQKSSEDAYYKDWLGKCFEKIYEGRKNYRLNRYLDHLEPKEQSESYQQFLNFMWNLSLDEIKNITEYYIKKGLD